MSFIKHIQGSPESSLTPLFLIHAVSGLSNPYSRLGQLTTSTFSISQDEERMVYGISSPVYNNRGTFKAPRTLEAMAMLYVDAIRKKQPYGPYLLGGWSMGGMLAVKMADILIRQGEQVLHVIVIDGANPEKLPPMSREEQNTMGDEIFARNLGFMSGGNSKVVSLRAPDSTGSSDSETLIASSSPRRVPPAVFSPHETFMMKVRSHIVLGLELMSSVEEGGWIQKDTPLRTRMTLVKCGEEAYLKDGQFGSKGQGLRLLMADECMGWKAEYFEEVKVVKLAGSTHDTCFEDDVVGNLTEILAECLAELC